jgi:anti-sigma B factor antagonist
MVPLIIDSCIAAEEVMQVRETGFPVEDVSGVLVVVAPEEIDVTNAEELRAALLQAAARGSGSFVVDMTRTRFCDSAGIHALVNAYTRARVEGGQVVLAVSGTSVPRIFALTGIDQMLPCFPSLAEALASVPAAEPQLG